MRKLNFLKKTEVTKLIMPAGSIHSKAPHNNMILMREKIIAFLSVDSF